MSPDSRRGYEATANCIMAGNAQPVSLLPSRLFERGERSSLVNILFAGRRLHLLSLISFNPLRIFELGEH